MAKGDTEKWAVPGVGAIRTRVTENSEELPD